MDEVAKPTDTKRKEELGIVQRFSQTFSTSNAKDNALQHLAKP